MVYSNGKPHSNHYKCEYSHKFKLLPILSSIKLLKNRPLTNLNVSLGLSLKNLSKIEFLLREIWMNSGYIVTSKYSSNWLNQH